MDLLVSFGLGVLASLLAQPLWYVFSGLAADLTSDLPKVRGKWIATFTEPVGGGASAEMQEEMRLHQLGRLVWGRAVRLDADREIVTYSGRIKRNTLVGSFRLKGDHTAIGRGAFQVTVADDDESMSGWAIWKDSDTKAIESSKIEFRSVA